MAADFGVPVWFEPVSVAKSKRVASVAKHVSPKSFLQCIIGASVYKIELKQFEFIFKDLKVTRDQFENPAGSLGLRPSSPFLKVFIS